MRSLDIDSIGTFVALGGTFSSHQAEKDRTYRWPDFWTLPDAAVIPGGDAVVLPPEVDAVNPGAELTAVIGTDIHRASEEEAWDAIEGFTISNDVTATGNWPGWSDPNHPMITGVGYKCLATFSPIQREVTPKRDRSHYQGLSVEVTVDGETSVSGSTSQMAFSIPEMVSFASHVTPLRENDVVALGDPGEPSVTLDEADSVTCSIESVGELTNEVHRL
jgi:2-keto-4-pentenoate hydratase/2-oxohepta-3-ene-1,7-dioic acid hydratase in catechol pathway